MGCNNPDIALRALLFVPQETAKTYHMPNAAIGWDRVSSGQRLQPEGLTNKPVGNLFEADGSDLAYVDPQHAACPTLPAVNAQLFLLAPILGPNHSAAKPELEVVGCGWDTRGHMQNDAGMHSLWDDVQEMDADRFALADMSHDKGSLVFHDADLMYPLQCRQSAHEAFDEPDALAPVGLSVEHSGNLHDVVDPAYLDQPLPSIGAMEIMHGMMERWMLPYLECLLRDS